MIRVRQVKIDIDDKNNLKNKIASILKIKNNIQ